MNEDSGEKKAKPRSLDELLKTKASVEQEIKDGYIKGVTVLFSDIRGYTAHVDKWGDISGRALVKKHNDIAVPLIEKHHGKLVKNIGDEVMASFQTPEQAAQAAVDIQKGLAEHNSHADRSTEVHVKIGINTGESLVEEGDVHGGVVNMASRIVSVADSDEILISRGLYDEICHSDDLLCRFYDTVKVKGIDDPVDVYRVVWRDEDVRISPEAKVRSLVEEAEGKEPRNVLHLEVTRLQDLLKISAYEQIAGEASTVRQYEEIPVPMGKIGARCQEIVETLNKANRKGRVSRDDLVRLRGIGQVFTDDLFPRAVKERIRETKAEHLILNLDDQLVQIPWELLSDGRQFLCQRFSMGRLVRTKQDVVRGSGSRALGRPLRMMVLADPKGDLHGAYSEGTQIRDHIDRETDLVNVSLRSGSITPGYVREKLRNFDLVHFAGHCDYNRENPSGSGWRVTEGNFRAEDIMKMAGPGVMPALIFSNACQSARTEEWGLEEYFHEEIFGLANAFVLAGVKHYIGTFWEILDEPSRSFALEFYKELLSGLNIGQAVQRARTALIEEYGEETIVWASYLLYGDPTYNYMNQIRATKASEHREEATRPGVGVRTEIVETGQKVIHRVDEKPRAKRPLGWISLPFLAALAIVLSWVWPGYLKDRTPEHERAILTYYTNGDFEGALNACRILEEKHPKVRLSYLVQGDIYLRRGRLDQAEAAYRQTLDATKGTDSQMARALIGLGRISSLRKQTPEALEYYRQATDLSPTSGEGYLAQAMLLDSTGNPKDALGLLGKAQELAPDNRLLSAVAGETRKKAAVTQDQERRDRIDGLVQELLERMESPPAALPSDGWTSSLLTLWIMDLDTKGYSLQEGEDRLLVTGIAVQILQRGRVQLVERALLEKLMEELKLGSSQLADRSTALNLGKILAAKLILTGQLIYSGPQTQITMRLIESETGRIAAAVSETFGSAVPASTMSDKLSETIRAKIEELYPIRGKITKSRGDIIELNIGRSVGLGVGQKLKAVNADLVLEVASVQADSSFARALEGEGAAQTGMRVEALP